MQPQVTPKPQVFTWQNAACVIRSFILYLLIYINISLSLFRSVKLGVECQVSPEFQYSPTDENKLGNRWGSRGWPHAVHQVPTVAESLQGGVFGIYLG
jgi:hypothetical protein